MNMSIFLWRAVFVILQRHFSPSGVDDILLSFKGSWLQLTSSATPFFCFHVLISWRMSYRWAQRCTRAQRGRFRRISATFLCRSWWEERPRDNLYLSSKASGLRFARVFDPQLLFHFLSSTFCFSLWFNCVPSLTFISPLYGVGMLPLCRPWGFSNKIMGGFIFL